MPAYFATLLPAIEGGYCVYFPDFPEIATQGDDLDEALYMGADILKAVLDDMVLHREKIPTPSNFEQAKKHMRLAMEEDKKDPRGTSLDHSREPLLQLFPAPVLDDTPVKLSVSIAKSALDAIDRKAKALGMTRSKFLVQSALAHC